MQLILREVDAPTGAFDLVMAEHVAPVHDAIGAPMAAATGKTEDDPRTRPMTHGMLMLCLRHGFQEPVVVRRLGRTGLSPDKVDEFVAEVADSVAAMLHLPAPGSLAADPGGDTP